MKVALRVVASVLFAATAVGLSGCGTTKLSASGAEPSAPASSTKAIPAAEELWSAAQASMKAATSVRIKGTATDNGVSIPVDMAGARDGSNAKVAISQNDWTAEILVVSGAVYVKGNAAYWTMAGLTAEQVQTVGTKYLKSTTVDVSKTTVGSMLDALSKVNFNLVDKLNIKVEKGEMAGVPVYVLSQRVSTADGDLTAWITADGKASLLKLTVVGGANPTDLVFSDWNSVQPFTAPPADQILSS